MRIESKLKLGGYYQKDDNCQTFFRGKIGRMFASMRFLCYSERVIPIYKQKYMHKDPLYEYEQGLLQQQNHTSSFGRKIY